MPWLLQTIPSCQMDGHWDCALSPTTGSEMLCRTLPPSERQAPGWLATQSPKPALGSKASPPAATWPHNILTRWAHVHEMLAQPKCTHPDIDRPRYRSTHTSTHGDTLFVLLTLMTGLTQNMIYSLSTSLKASDLERCMVLHFKRKEARSLPSA